MEENINKLDKTIFNQKNENDSLFLLTVRYLQLHNVFEYFLLFVVIWINEDTLLFGTNENANYIITKYVVYILLILVLIVRFYKGYEALPTIVLLFIITLVLITALINFDYTGGYFYQIITILLSFLLVRSIKFLYFTIIYNKFIYFLSLFSLTAFVITQIFPSILGNFPVITTFSGAKSYNLFFCVINHSESYSILRNTGIFREPGVYIIYLNIAIIFNLFLHKTINLKQLLVFCITVISTQSTAGVIVTGFIIMLYVMLDKKKFDSRFKYLGWAILISAIIYFLYNPNITKKVFGKLKASSDLFNSTMARVESLVVPGIIFIHNPVFGSGLSTFPKDFQNFSFTYFGTGLSSSGTATNTIMNKFATYGALFGMIFLYALFRFSYKILGNRRKYMSVLLFIILFAMFGNEDMRYSLIFNMMFFYSFYSSELSKSRFDRELK